MSNLNLKMNVSLQSINQPQLCEQMLETMIRDDRGSLLIVSSTQKISVSSKILQIFSPLYRDMLRDVPSLDNNPMTIFLPDFEVMHVRHLLDLLTSGRIKDKQLPLGSAGDILNLAKCFGIDLKESDLRVSFKDTREKPPQRTKVKNIDVMMFSTVPCEYFEKEEAKTSFSQDLQEIINIDERIDVVDHSEENSCVFCFEKIRGGNKSLKSHEEKCQNSKPNETEEVMNMNIDTGTGKIVREDYRDREKCPFCLKNFGRNPYKIHVKECRVRKSLQRQKQKK